MIKSYKDFLKESNVGMGSMYHTMYPYQYQTMDNPSDRGKEGNVEYHKTNNRFQQIQDEIKNLIENDLRKKDNNLTEQDIENEIMKFFNIGNIKKQEIRKISDDCNDIKKCAKEIYDKFGKYSKLNNMEDDVNDVPNNLIENFEWDYEEYDIKKLSIGDDLCNIDDFWIESGTLSDFITSVELKFWDHHNNLFIDCPLIKSSDKKTVFGSIFILDIKKSDDIDYFHSEINGEKIHVPSLPLLGSSACYDLTGIYRPPNDVWFMLIDSGWPWFKIPEKYL